MTNDYHFITRWRFEATAEEVFEVVCNPLRYPCWWPSVYLKAEELDCGDDHGIGRRFRLHTRGWLPYTLDWESCAIEVARPHRLVIRASGDFVGRGIWSIQQTGSFVDVAFDWKVTAHKPLLRYASFLLRPVFKANHRWAMRRGQEGLQRELKRLNTLPPR